jgi:very-short-patch-repair endonuclease
MPSEQIIRGQKVRPGLLELAKQMRREMTPAERALWQELRVDRLNGLNFRRQQVIDDFIVDFYCHSAGLVVEVDGPIHEQQHDHDTARDEMLANRGLRVLRVTNDEILHKLDTVLDRIAKAAAHAAQTNLPHPR